MKKLRIDKWLWAARFFKTRALAKKAIEGGKVRINGQRPKVSKEIVAGDELQLRLGFVEKTVLVENLSDQRRGAPEAALLYTETEQSIKLREQQSVLRKLSASHDHPDKRPTKKQRRQIHQFKSINSNADSE